MNGVAARRSSQCADVVWIVGLFLLSSCLAWQGWKSKTTESDRVPLIESATAFLNYGTVPDRGCISAYSSFCPPGTAWLFLPGVALFSDYRLFELCGGLFLHISTLVGLFLLTRIAFNGSAARIAVALYAFSSVGLYYAQSLWPRGHPVFCVWLVLWTLLWCMSKDPKYLAAAIVTFAAGMYVHMELAPLAIVLPAVWILYRPPLRARPVLIAALLSLLMWFPYLRFERARGFRDLASMTFLVDIMPRDYALLPCDPVLRREVLGHKTTSPTAMTRLRDFVRGRAESVRAGLLGNLTFTSATTLASGVAVARWTRALLLLIVTLLALSEFVPPWARGSDVPADGDRRRLLSAALLGGVSALIFAALFIQHRYGAEWLEPELTAAAAGISALFVGVCQWFRSRPADARNSPTTDVQTIVILALLLPSLTLVLLSEGYTRRFQFLWPLQVVLIAFALTDAVARYKLRGLALRFAQVALIALVLVSPEVIEKIADWKTNGPAGADSDMLRAVEYVAREVHSDGRRDAAIGYWLPGVVGTEDAYHAIDPRYKIGMVMDYILNQRFQVRNSNRCPEGISGEDEYRIIYRDLYLDAPEYSGLRLRAYSGFRTVKRFGEYAVATRSARLPGRLASGSPSSLW